MTSHKTIRLKPKEGRRARAGAPWVFSNEIEMDAAAKALAPGTVVNVAGDDGQLFGTGYFNPKSLIARAHAGSQRRRRRSDRIFSCDTLARALAMREALYAKPFYRLVHAEGDGLPGPDHRPFRRHAGGADHDRRHGNAARSTARGARRRRLRPPTSSCATTRRRARSKGSAIICRARPRAKATRIAVEENGVRYFADLASGQKTGWYYDQRDNRAFMAELAHGQAACSMPIATPAASALLAAQGRRARKSCASIPRRRRWRWRKKPRRRTASSAAGS